MKSLYRSRSQISCYSTNEKKANNKTTIIQIIEAEKFCARIRSNYYLSGFSYLCFIIVIEFFFLY